MNQEPLTIKIIAVGDGDVGKTSILLTYTQDQFPTDYVPTVFENYTSLAQVDGTQVQLSLWDTAGQESYARLRVLSYQSANAFLLIFSIDKKATFDNIWNKWIPELKQQGKDNVPKIIVGNKCDKSSEFMAYYQEKCQQEGYYYIESSALLNKNIKPLFEEIIRMALREAAMKSVMHSNVITKKKKSQSVCQLL